MDLDYSLMMGLDYNLMMDLTDIELKLGELEAGYKKKYFRKDTKRAWSFKCHCDEKVVSNITDEYFIVSITWKDPNASGYRFCSKECVDIYIIEQRNELLVERERIIEERRKMREVYEEAERKFIALKEKS
ncbi:hypothetical protein LAV72_12520 [Lysinibacillus xylanilyticus]|uniref:hypothetical protein n=1 Tax=Lysinibacillus xylanilyticus TaxID=582475 RepID=UPI002B2543B3|nr:hypothetical protein [Lysinibacillus xylanilyticus]MEB2300440.1 hypothetical protein [Lysinibacillus xylanilyticus]